MSQGAQAASWRPAMQAGQTTAQVAWMGDASGLPCPLPTHNAQIQGSEKATKCWGQRQSWGEQWAAPPAPTPLPAIPTVPKRTLPGPLPSSSQAWERALDPITLLPCELAPSTGEARGRAAVMRGGGLGEPKLPPLAWHSGGTDPPSPTHAPARLTPARATQY